VKTVEVLITGRVQSVGFRACVRRIAESLIIEGEVMNLTDGRVRVYAVTEPVILEKFISMLYSCPRAIIRDIRVHEIEDVEYQDFSIKRGLF